MGGPEIMIILTGINPANTYVEADNLIHKDKQIQVDNNSFPSSTKVRHKNDSVQTNNSSSRVIRSLLSD